MIQSDHRENQDKQAKNGTTEQSGQTTKQPDSYRTRVIHIVNNIVNNDDPRNEAIPDRCP